MRAPYIPGRRGNPAAQGISPFAERDIGVIFAGNYVPPEHLTPHIRHMDEESKAFYLLKGDFKSQNQVWNPWLSKDLASWREKNSRVSTAPFMKIMRDICNVFTYLFFLYDMAELLQKAAYIQHIDGTFPF